LASFFAIGAVAGILLGLRFKVLVLLPAILVATVAIILIGGELRVIVFTELGTVALLQVGYFVGSVLAAVLRAPPSDRT
jgi:hypothetical protein